MYTKKVDTKIESGLYFVDTKGGLSWITNTMMMILKNPLLILFKTVKRRCKFLKNTAFHISRWVKLYSTVTTEDGDILTAKQVKALQKRLLQLEEENLILKKAIWSAPVCQTIFNSKIS